MEEPSQLTEEELLAAAEQAAKCAEEETDEEAVCAHLEQAVEYVAAAGERHWRKQLKYLRKMAVQYEKKEDCLCDFPFFP